MTFQVREGFRPDWIKVIIEMTSTAAASTFFKDGNKFSYSHILTVAGNSSDCASSVNNKGLWLTRSSEVECGKIVAERSASVHSSSRYCILNVGVWL